MKNLWFAISLLFVSSFASAAPTPIPAAPELPATAWILLDHNSGQVLAEKNADQQIEPASITKIMTAYVVYQALQDGMATLDDQVTISEKAWRMKGSRMFIEVGKEVRLGDLIKGLVIQSGNDAAVALAEYIAGTESAFVDQMNITAQSLGMNNTHFENVTGWPGENHLTTARDISILSQALINNFPKYYENYSIKEFEYNNIKQPNRNRLLWRDNSVDGIKTGHTDAAGYCLAASAQRGDMRLISVVMGTKSDSARAKSSQTLMNYGFRYFESHKLYTMGDTLQDLRIWKGSQENLAIGPQQDVYVTIPRGQYKNLRPSLENVPTPLEAPINKGTELGRVQVYLGEEVIADIPAIALQEVTEGSFFSKLTDTVLLLFE